jgi:hypothetical protein
MSTRSSTTFRIRLPPSAAAGFYGPALQRRTAAYVGPCQCQHAVPADCYCCMYAALVQRPDTHGMLDVVSATY